MLGNSTQTDAASPERPRSAAFGNSKVSKEIPKSVGQYDYRTMFPEHNFKDLYYIASLIRDVLKVTTYYGFSDEPEWADINRLPRLDQFIAQVIMITNAPCCVLAGVLRLLLRYYGEDSERDWPQCWMNAYDTFLAAFILTSRACKDMLDDPIDLTYKHWAKVTTYNQRTVELIVACFEWSFEGDDFESDVQLLVRSFNQRYESGCAEGELKRGEVPVKMLEQQAKGTVKKYCADPAPDAPGPEHFPKIPLSELTHLASDDDGEVDVPRLLSHILRKTPNVKPRNHWLLRKFCSKVAEHIHL